MRKSFLILMLPLLLLFAQQAELRHEFSHDADQTSIGKKPVPGDTCPTCLAYAHIAGAAKPEVTAAGLASDLAFHFAPAVQVASASVEGLPPRSRGPPTL